jgi:hypothetical protein
MDMEDLVFLLQNERISANKLCYERTCNYDENDEYDIFDEYRSPLISSGYPSLFVNDNATPTSKVEISIIVRGGKARDQVSNITLPLRDVLENIVNNLFL